MLFKPNSIILYVFRRPWLVALISSIGMLQGYLMFKNSTFFQRKWIDIPFEEITIAARIDTIMSYSRGFPVVAMSDGRKLLLELPDAGQKYVQVNDSLVKSAGTRTVSVYRSLEFHTEDSIFNMDSPGGENDLEYAYSGLIKRYRIKNH